MRVNIGAGWSTPAGELSKMNNAIPDTVYVMKHPTELNMRFLIREDGRVLLNGSTILSIDRARKLWRVCLAEGYVHNRNLDE